MKRIFFLTMAVFLFCCPSGFSRESGTIAFKTFTSANEPGEMIDNGPDTDPHLTFNFLIDLGAASPTIVVDKNGGKYIVDFSAPPDADIEALRDHFARCSAGQIGYWNSDMRIELTRYDNVNHNHQITVTAGPRFAAATLTNDTYLATNAPSQPHLIFRQEGRGSLVEYNLTGHPTNPGMTYYDIALSGSQPMVLYNLFLDFRLHDTKMGTGEPFIFTHCGMGDYIVEAVSDKYPSYSISFDTLKLRDVTYPRSNDNYVSTRTYTEVGPNYLDVTYFDGLGYPTQTVSVGASPSLNRRGANKNIVSPVYYDHMRRDDARLYMPYASENETGEKERYPISGQWSYYRSMYGSGENSYRENIYEASPLNRVLESYNVGRVFRNPGVPGSTFGYGVNGPDEVPRIERNGTLGLKFNGYYGKGTLIRQEATNEDGNTVITFMDTQDKLVLQRQVSGPDQYFDTHYVYDEWGNICYVLPPMLSAIAVDKTSDDLSYGNWVSFSSDLDCEYIGNRLKLTVLRDLVFGGILQNFLPPGGVAPVEGLTFSVNVEGLGSTWNVIPGNYPKMDVRNSRSQYIGSVQFDRGDGKYTINLSPEQIGDGTLSLAAIQFFETPQTPGNYLYITPSLRFGMTEHTGPTLNEALQQSGYIYRYDERNRCIEKKLPGADWVYYVYDRMDRLVAEQDSYYRENGSWKCIRHDGLGRCTLVGSYRSNYSRSQMQAVMDDTSGSPWLSWDIKTIHALDYDDPGGVRSDPALVFEAVPGVVSMSDVVQLKAMLDHDRKALTLATEFHIYGYTRHRYFYDYKGRLIQKVDRNHLGYISRTSYKYDFTGNVLSMHESHTVSGDGTTDVLRTDYTYDRRGRLLSETTTLNNSTPAVVKHAYDDLGRTKTKSHGAGENAPTETYDYTIQGWLSEKTSPYFDMKLRYYDPDNRRTEPRYSGDITEWEWKHKGPGIMGVHSIPGVER